MGSNSGANSSTNTNLANVVSALGLVQSASGYNLPAGDIWSNDKTLISEIERLNGRTDASVDDFRAAVVAYLGAKEDANNNPALNGEKSVADLFEELEKILELEDTVSGTASSNGAAPNGTARTSKRLTDISDDVNTIADELNIDLDGVKTSETESVADTIDALETSAG